MTAGVPAAYNWTKFPRNRHGRRHRHPTWPLFLDASPASKGILFDEPHLRAELKHRSFSCVFCRNMNSERVGRTGSIRKHIRTLKIRTLKINTKPFKTPNPSTHLIPILSSANPTPQLQH